MGNRKNDIAMKRFLLSLIVLCIGFCGLEVTAEPMPSPVPTSAKKIKTPKVYMGLWGSIGETQCPDFTMNGTTGYYILNGQEKARRTLKLVSYNEKTSRCVINAYFKGKYIGKFDGVYTEDYVPEADKYVCVYNCTLISVNGTKLDCYLYID